MRSIYALALLPLLAAAANVPIPKKGWTFTADSSAAGNDIAKAFDDDVNTFWITKAGEAFPNKVTIDLKKVYVVNGFEYVPRQDGSTEGFPGVHTVEVSKDNKTWTRVISGTLIDEGKRKKTNRFTDIAAQYVRFTATTEVSGKKVTSAAEINILSPNPSTDGNTFSTLSTKGGRWGETIVFPVVPVAIGLMPNDQLLTWSSYKPDEFEFGLGKTTTATWDIASNGVSGRTISETNHDMFCPGLSLDEDNRFNVAGGNNAKTTSIYFNGAWKRVADMKIGRGYQSQTTLADGRAFTIGGSYTDPAPGKNGEVYDPKKDTWTLLNKADVTKILTDDHEGIYRSDNHAWLFAWKGNSVFQAGPSKQMNWFGTNGNGSTVSAGLRANDGHSMCGNAVLYDAVAGKILTHGGSPEYENGTATAAAHIITMGDPDKPVKVEKLGNAAFTRGYQNSVILPSGEVVIIGGMDYLVPFTDKGSRFIPEIWNPDTKKFTQLNPIATGRNYHSTATLLRDGTIFSGGGGLCGDCEDGNHMDGQVFSPPYLFNADGSLATRPVIKKAPTTTKAGATISVTTDGDVKSFALVRYGSATHGINTDQRRVPLTATKGYGAGEYTMTLPVDKGILLTGPWMLFAMSSKGVPSVGATVSVRLS